MVTVATLISIGAPSMAKAQAQAGINFHETSNGAGTDSLTSSNPGAVITGTSDNWNIDLSALGITLSANDLPQAWVEAPGENGVNYLTIVDPTTLNLQSEFTGSTPTPDNFCGTGSPLPDGTTCFIGTDTAGTEWFATVTESGPESPEPGTFMLLGLGVAGVAAIRRRKIA